MASNDNRPIVRCRCDEDPECNLCGGAGLRASLRRRRAPIDRSNWSYADRSRDSSLWARYGITLDDFNRMFDAQGRRCACCGTDEPGSRKRDWCVDHNHTSLDNGGPRTVVRHGECVVRGVVCFRCNIQIGVIEHANWPQLFRYLGLPAKKSA